MVDGIGGNELLADYLPGGFGEQPVHINLLSDGGILVGC
jgi:hypothetical protein